MLTEEGRESYPVGLYKVQGLAAVCLSAALDGSALLLFGHAAHLLKNEQLPLWLMVVASQHPPVSLGL